MVGKGRGDVDVTLSDENKVFSAYFPRYLKNEVDLKSIASEPSKIMTAVAIAFVYLAFRNCISGLECTLFVVTVPTAAMASFQPFLHLAAFFLGVTVS